MPALDVTVDYYHIAIDDRIVLSGNFTAPPIAALLAPFGANSARFFTNAIDTRTNGVDVTANYRIALDAAGDVRLRAGYNNTRTKIVGADRHAAAAGRVRVGAVRSHRAAAASSAASRRTACGSAATGAGAGSASIVERRALRRVLQLHAESRPTIRRTAPKWLTDVEALVPRRRLHAGGRRAEPVRRLPGPQHDRQLVQRHPDVPEPLAVRHERPGTVWAGGGHVLRDARLRWASALGTGTWDWGPGTRRLIPIAGWNLEHSTLNLERCSLNPEPPGSRVPSPSPSQTHLNRNRSHTSSAIGTSATAATTARHSATKT